MLDVAVDFLGQRPLEILDTPKLPHKGSGEGTKYVTNCCTAIDMRLLKSAFNVGGLAGGVHPFPFRTRKLSLLAPMVLLH